VCDGYEYKFWVYILVSCSGTLYVGVTGYIDRRISQHKMDSIEGFTRKYKIHRLVHYETYRYVLNAINREKQLKGWRREKKIALIEKTIHAGRIWPSIGGEKCASGDSPSRKRLDAA
jgi:putative endonuclease